MFGKVILAGFVAVLIVPTVGMAQNQYEQCQQACAGDGLSCVNKCMGQGGGGDNSGNNQQQNNGGSDTAVEVDGDSAGYVGEDLAHPDADAAAAAARRNNNLNGTVGDTPRVGEPFGRRRF